jgi:hypothetical protein
MSSRTSVGSRSLARWDFSPYTRKLVTEFQGSIATSKLLVQIFYDISNGQSGDTERPELFRDILDLIFVMLSWFELVRQVAAGDTLTYPR